MTGGTCYIVCMYNNIIVPNCTCIFSLITVTFFYFALAQTANLHNVFLSFTLITYLDLEADLNEDFRDKICKTHLH